MKKTAATAAVVLLGTFGVSACSSQLTTADTCVELRAIVAGFPTDGEPSDDDLQTIGDQFEDLATQSSDTLKDDIRTAGDIISRGIDGPAPTSDEEDALDRLDEICDLSDVG